MCFLFPILYAASIGPVCRLQSLAGCRNHEMVLTCFYLPIAFAVENSPFVAPCSSLRRLVESVSPFDFELNCSMTPPVPDQD